MMANPIQVNVPDGSVGVKSKCLSKFIYVFKY